MSTKKPKARATAKLKFGGKPYRTLVARYIATKFATEDLEVFEEVSLGSSIIGKERRVDLLVISARTRKAVALQAKFQGVPGTTDEKIHYSLADCAAMWLPAAVVYGGGGWSIGVRHTLEASRHAVRCEIDEAGAVVESEGLDSFLASIFEVWKPILGNKKPVVASAGGT